MGFMMPEVAKVVPSRARGERRRWLEGLGVPTSSASLDHVWAAVGQRNRACGRTERMSDDPFNLQRFVDAQAGGLY
jgi:hypothetical protein